MDIVERLRGDYSDERLRLAADEIERLREQERKMTNHALERMEEIERLREALEYCAYVIERLRRALKRISICEGGDVTVIWKEMRDIAIEALQQKDSKS